VLSSKKDKLIAYLFDMVLEKEFDFKKLGINFFREGANYGKANYIF
jgi:hypothetical protein